MPAFEGMHSPGSEVAHLLPPAGVTNCVDEMFRFHKVIPICPPDPCVRPHEAELICPPEKPKNDVAAMMPAGITTMPVSDRFAFYKAREGSSTNPCQQRGGHSRRVEQPCPCSNRCPTVVRQPSYDLRYMYPGCVNYPQQSSIITPLFHDPSPYMDCSISPAPPQNQWTPEPCRPRFGKRFMAQCPTTDPPHGPMFAMLARCMP